MCRMISPQKKTNKPFENASAKTVLEWAVRHFHPRIAIASSFSVEDTIVIDLATQIQPDITVFTIDTGYHFKETEEVKERIKSRYRLNLIEYQSELSIPQQNAQYGEALYHKDPDLCCRLRKIEPIQRALKELDAWITGLRNEQSPTRRDLHTITRDELNGRTLYKINPLARWTQSQVWQYALDHQLPYNTLYNRGYTSIGCIHCTQPVKPGEDPRSGRWSGTDKKECGIHTFMATKTSDSGHWEW